MFVEAEFGGCVFECSDLIGVVAVPAAGRESRRVGADQTRCFPGLYLYSHGFWEVGAFVNDPGDGLGERWW